LIFQPDTASGGSHRQNQHAGHLVMPTDRNNSNKDQPGESKISQLLRESPGLSNSSI
jgi:hypothetical protein